MTPTTRPPLAPPHSTSIFPRPPILLPKFHIPTPKGHHPPRVPPPLSPTDAPVAHRTRSHASTSAPPPNNPIASHTRSRVCPSFSVSAHAAARRTYPSALLHKWALPVLDKATGQTLEYRQLCQHPDFHKIWNESYSNELGRLCQGIGTSPNGTSKRVKGTNTFFLIRFEDIPADCRKEITYTKVVCKVRPEKNDPNCTCITLPSDVGTPIT